MSCIPDVEGIMPACVSEGCPAVSSKFFSFIRQIIDSRKKPVLLWIFDSNLEELVVEDNREQNNYKFNFASQIHQELSFFKNDYPHKSKKKYTKLALNSDINCAEQNNSTDKIFFTLKPGYALPSSSSWTQVIANTKPASNQIFYSPVDIGYVFTKRRKNQYITY
jgi:hypothetical protein